MEFRKILKFKKNRAAPGAQLLSYLLALISRRCLDEGPCRSIFQIDFQ